MRSLFIFILLSFPLLTGAFNTTLVDSVGARVIGGRQYLIHQIEPKETWFSLYRMYHVSVQELQATNPGMKTLLIGKTVLIPLSGNYFSTTRSNTAFSGSPQPRPTVKGGAKTRLIPAAPPAVPPASPTTAKIHVVQPGETMYRLSKMYGVSIADIQHWNNIPDYTLSVGQSVVVAGPGSMGIALNGGRSTYAPHLAANDARNTDFTAKNANNKAIDIAVKYVQRKGSIGEPGDMSVMDSLEKKAKSTIVNKNAVPLAFSNKPAAAAKTEVKAGGAASAPTGTPTAVAPATSGTLAKPASPGGRPNIRVIGRTKPAETTNNAAPGGTAVLQQETAAPIAAAESPAERPKPAQTITVMQPSAHYTPPINKGLPTSAPYTGVAVAPPPPKPVSITTKVDHKKVEIPVNQSFGLPKRDSNIVVPSSSGVKTPTTTADKTTMKEVVEHGTAAWINDEDVNPNKYYALHKKAPIGTIIKVTNIANKQSLFVKVVGALPETADNATLVIKISKSAAKKLVVMEPKFQAELSYGVAQ